MLRHQVDSRMMTLCVDRLCGPMLAHFPFGSRFRKNIRNTDQGCWLYGSLRPYLFLALHRTPITLTLPDQCMTRDGWMVVPSFGFFFTLSVLIGPDHWHDHRFCSASAGLMRPAVALCSGGLKIPGPDNLMNDSLPYSTCVTVTTRDVC